MVVTNGGNASLAVQNVTCPEDCSCVGSNTTGYMAASGLHTGTMAVTTRGGGSISIPPRYAITDSSSLSLRAERIAFGTAREAYR